jgi:hypothetical protein
VRWTCRWRGTTRPHGPATPSALAQLPSQDWRHLLDLHYDDDATFAPSPSVFCLLLAAVDDSWEIAGTLDNGEKQETAVQ